MLLCASFVGTIQDRWLTVIVPHDPFLVHPLDSLGFLSAALGSHVLIDFLISMKKRISIDRLRRGMYIAGLDQSWFKTPFLRHKWLIKREDEIHLLQAYGIQEILIDTQERSRRS